MADKTLEEKIKKLQPKVTGGDKIVITVTGGKVSSQSPNVVVRREP